MRMFTKSQMGRRSVSLGANKYLKGRRKVKRTTRILGLSLPVVGLIAVAVWYFKFKKQ